MQQSGAELEYWTANSAEVLERLSSRINGLTHGEASDRLALHGRNLPKSARFPGAVSLFLSQFKSPIILILIFAAAASYVLESPSEATIIIVIVMISGTLGFWQERGAVNTTKKLLAMIQTKATVLRDGKPAEVPLEETVQGDIVILNAGDAIPGDCLILESKDLFVNEATLTGESYPVEKSPGALTPDTPLHGRVNSLFMGTYVVSGSAKAAIALTGLQTELGKLSAHIRSARPETEFEHGVRRFGYFLIEVTLVLVIANLVVNVYLQRSVLDSLLFSLALAIGLTPQLLPAIISVNLAHGARRMAKDKVIVKRLASIENLGSMNILCSDKTGTLTQGVVKLHSAVDVHGRASEKVIFYAYLNSFHETGFTNPIDQAIIEAGESHGIEHDRVYEKLDEVPFDFARKRLSILVSIKKEDSDKHLLLTKGALHKVLEVCSDAEISEGNVVDLSTVKESIEEQFRELSSKGFRLIGVAYSDVGSASQITKNDEKNMTFLGLLVLFDPIKPGIIESVYSLKQLGISLKMISGDNKLIATHVGHEIGLSVEQIMVGPELNHIDSNALIKRVNEADIFAEIEPNQKERIILALRKSGHTVGYMGDGINDAPSLHAADVGISVDTASDIVKEEADIVLLEKHLEVLADGVEEGRRTFANTLKYVFMATSANFGNMFSMAGVSSILSFLPLLPKQVLLTNLMTDFPEMTIGTDNVDPELVRKPRHWDIKLIRKFMLTFGLLSTLFDFLTFGFLIFVLNATTTQFRTAWFMESVISASLIVLVIRTRKTFLRSRPSKFLLISTAAVIVATLILPLIAGFSEFFGFTALDSSFYLSIALIVTLYIIGAELVKAFFYRKAMRNA
jgi:Mg2+-importing ATPase